jgi:hypothetical protein
MEALLRVWWESGNPAGVASGPSSHSPEEILTPQCFIRFICAFGGEGEEFRRRCLESDPESIAAIMWSGQVLGPRLLCATEIAKTDSEQKSSLKNGAAWTAWRNSWRQPHLFPESAAGLIIGWQWSFRS